MIEGWGGRAVIFFNNNASSIPLERILTSRIVLFGTIFMQSSLERHLRQILLKSEIKHAVNVLILIFPKLFSLCQHWYWCKEYAQFCWVREADISILCTILNPRNKTVEWIFSLLFYILGTSKISKSCSQEQPVTHQRFADVLSFPWLYSKQEAFYFFQKYHWRSLMY